MPATCPDYSPSLRRIASRAATLTERLAAGRGPVDTNTECLDGRAVIEAWRAGCAAPDDAAFAARLAWDGLTPATALAGASTPIYARGPLPPWTEWLRGALEEAFRTADDLEAAGLADVPLAEGIPEPPFIELAMPWLRVARRELARRAPDEGETFPRAALEAQLLHECGLYAGTAFHQTFTHNTPASRPGSEAYRTFVLAMLRGGLVALFEAFPALARQLALIVESWVESTAELRARLARDRHGIEAAFAGGSDAGHVTAIRPALSDPHDGRRRVAAVEFANGLRVVYKPRSLASDAAFFDLLEWAARSGLAPAPPTLRALARDTFGWVEYATASDGFTVDGARRYFEQAGGLLCWAHVCRGRDLHMENVIATDRGPVLIDLEVIAQPVRADEMAVWSDAGPELSELLPAGGASCLQTGLLTMLEVREDLESIDVGGLRGTPRSLSALTVKVWRHLRTAAIAQIDEPAPAARVSNSVVVDGRRADPGEFLAEVVSGFEATYRFLLAHRDELLAPGGPLEALARCHVRVLPRSTNYYAQVMQALAGPRYQTDGAVRSAWLDIFARPYIAVPGPPSTWPLVRAEQATIASLDVPRFSMAADGTSLYAGGALVMEGYVSTSGLAAVRHVIRSLSEDDLTAQRARLTAALADSVESRFSVRIETPPSQASEGVHEPALLGAAVSIGRELLARGDRAPGRAGPPGGIESLAIYRGRMGLPLFYAALARVTEEDGWRAAAHAAVAPVLEGLRARRTDISDPVGICSGTASVAYGLGLVARLVGEPAYLDAAMTAAAAIDPDGNGQAGPDVTDGWAGAILALVSLHDATREPRLLATAERCAERLVATEVHSPSGSVWPIAGSRRFLGFAHGSAGIGTAARLLARASGHSEWEALGARAWQTVDGAFLDASGNWPIEQPIAGGGAAMTAWCHGSPGILIGLSRTLDIGWESAILTHATAALISLRQVPDHLEEHVCCGNLGRAEALLSYGLRSKSQAMVEAARASGIRVVERAARRQHVRLAASGFEYPVFSRGFFRGLSGVGYQLLRLAAPSLVPSVLGFE